mgnify:CR=1 FL=1
MVFWPKRRRVIHRNMGTLDPLFRDLLQACGYWGRTKMTNQTLLLIAGLVFTLMVTGLFLTLHAAGTWRDPSQDKESSE